MLRKGWNLQVCSNRSGNHKPLLIFREGIYGSTTVKVSFSVIDVLQKAKIILPTRSMDNQRIWIYELTDAGKTLEISG